MKKGPYSLLVGNRYIRGFGQGPVTQTIKQNKDMYITPRTEAGKDIHRQRDMPSTGLRALYLFVRKYSRPKAHSYVRSRGQNPTHVTALPNSNVSVNFLYVFIKYSVLDVFSFRIIK